MVGTEVVDSLRGPSSEGVELHLHRLDHLDLLQTAGTQAIFNMTS